MDPLRIQGYRLTRQRRLVLETLRDSQEHLDAAAVFERVKAREPRISLATVYRSLALLKETGLVLEDRLGEGHGHFEAAQATPHYHFTCLGCGRVVELQAPRALEAVRELCAAQGLQATAISLHIRGYCIQCQSAETKGEQP